MRQIVLDTETTGLEPQKGHRMIEIGCVELDNRRPTGRTYHQYINPQRLVDAGAVEVHGIDNEFLADKPVFADIVDEMLDFLGTAELVIHNAPFDVGFINHELRLWRSTSPGIEARCAILDTLMLARDRHPGQRNSLDALCKRYDIDNTNRTLHGALLDARILTDVYLTMTGGQVSLVLADEDSDTEELVASHKPVDRMGLTLVQATVSADEQAAHEAALDRIDSACEAKSVWRRVPDH
ncbi:MAG: DNA polymerase III subunit epsilon [Gammaproteobacteria bacterium]